MRRSPLSAFGVYATCFVLLVGCEAPVEPQQPVTPQPPPAQSSLSFEISGPSVIDTEGSFSWNAFAFGGSGAYQYQWDVTRQAGTRGTSTATGARLTVLVAAGDGDVVVSLRVTSGTESLTQNFRVRNCIGGCPK